MLKMTPNRKSSSSLSKNDTLEEQKSLNRSKMFIDIVDN